jgi:hypothetical protein
MSKLLAASFTDIFVLVLWDVVLYMFMALAKKDVQA